MGVHVLSLDIEDIYFLMGLSHRGACVNPIWGRGGGLSMSDYIRRHYEPDAKRCKDKVAIREIGLSEPSSLPLHGFIAHGAPELFSICH
jgi:hypothetical protein